MQDENISYFHWKDPEFPTAQFAKWPKWNFYRINNTPAFDDITRRNLKIFFPKTYSHKRLLVIEQLLHHLGFTCTNRFPDRYIFRYDNPENIFLVDLVNNLVNNAV